MATKQPRLTLSDLEGKTLSDLRKLKQMQTPEKPKYQAGEMTPQTASTLLTTALGAVDNRKFAELVEGACQQMARV